MANEQFLKPGASRIQCSVQHKIFSINDEGKRVQIGAIQSIAESQTKDTYRTFELGNPECLEVTQGLVTDININAKITHPTILNVLLRLALPGFMATSSL